MEHDPQECHDVPIEKNRSQPQHIRKYGCKKPAFDPPNNSQLSEIPGTICPQSQPRDARERSSQSSIMMSKSPESNQKGGTNFVSKSRNPLVIKRDTREFSA